MTWSSLFSWQVLQRGKFEYENGHVQGLTQEENSYQAWVEGDEDYCVTIDLSDPEKPEMSCTCDAASGGIPCRHMAAVMYAMEGRTQKQGAGTGEMMSGENRDGNDDRSGIGDLTGSESRSGIRNLTGTESRNQIETGNLARIGNGAGSANRTESGTRTGTGNANRSGSGIATQTGTGNANRSGSGIATQTGTGNANRSGIEIGSGSRKNMKGSTSVTERAEVNDGKPHRVYPFGQNPDLLWQIGSEEQREYHYFDLAAITKNYDIYSDVYERAKNGIRKGGIRMEPLECRYEPDLDLRNIVCTVKGKVRLRNADWEVKLIFNKDRILKKSCDVPGCDCNKTHRYLQRVTGYSGMGSYVESKDKLCVHMLAALLQADKQLKEQNPGDETDRNAQKMLHAYRRRRAEIISEAENVVAAENVHLEPRLTLEKDGLKAAFRIGTDKFYVLKSLSEFVDTVERKGILELGTKAKLDMALHDFSEQSGRYYGFLKTIIRGEQSRSHYADTQIGRNADLSEYIRDTVPLYGRRLDDFFDLCCSRTMEFTDRRNGGGHYTIQLREKDPKPRLTLTRIMERGTFAGILAEGELPELIEGENYSYYLEEHCLNRLPKSSYDKMKPLMQLADYGNRIRFTVGVNNLSEFYYRVLPVLRDCARIEEPDHDYIEANLPPEAEFRFYLDAEEGALTCRAAAVYGEEEYPLISSAGHTGGNHRDGQLEKETLTAVRSYFPEEGQEGIYICSNDPDDVYRLLETGLSRLMEFGEIHASDRFRRLRIHRNTKMSIGISLESHLLNLEVLSDELDHDELLDILYSYQEKKKYYRMKNGDFLSLEQDDLMEMAAMLKAMGITPKEFTQGKMQLPLYRALYLNKLLEENEGIYARRDSSYRKLVKEFKTVRDSDFEVPENLQKVMRNYQIYGYKWLRTLQQGHFGGILADDMGLGKTLQMISVIAADRAENPDQQDHLSLVVCPASLVFNWKEEFSRFAPQLKVQTITGNQPVRQEKIADRENWDVFITSYDLLKRDAAEYEDILFRYEVIDEAQYIKNHTTEAAKAVKIMKAQQRYALTGTPIENRLSELWSIFDFLMPGLLYDYPTFRRDFETSVMKNQDQEVMKQLKRMVSPFILRRLKKDVLKDLPDKLEEVRYASMDAEQRNLYDGQVTHMKQLLEGMDEAGYRQNRITILAEITKIRKICCDPSLQVESYTGSSAKREACMDLIASAIEGEHKLLVFSQFVTMLELLEADLQKAGISYYMITGSVPKEKRLELVKAFNSDNTPVFLISLKAGGTGLNLTGADVVIHYDPWWNLAAQNQATDRAHRIGQTKVVSVYRLIAKDTIEEKILQMQEDKQNLADEILSSENGGLGNLSKEELQQLFM